MARFGSVTVAADECRDARGTALLENVVRDVLYACRSFRRSPLVALTIVTTVGLGLGLVAVVFTLLNAFIFRVDEVRNPHELFAVKVSYRPTRSPKASRARSMKRSSARRACSPMHSRWGQTSTAGSMAGGWRARS